MAMVSGERLSVHFNTGGGWSRSCFAGRCEAAKDEMAQKSASAAAKDEITKQNPAKQSFRLSTECRMKGTLFKPTPSVNESAAWVLRGVRKPAKEGDRGAND